MNEQEEEKMKSTVEMIRGMLEEAQDDINDTNDRIDREVANITRIMTNTSRGIDIAGEVAQSGRRIAELETERKGHRDTLHKMRRLLEVAEAE